MGKFLQSIRRNFKKRKKQKEIKKYWQEEKIKEIFNVAAKENRDKIIERHEYGPPNKTDEEIFAEELINEMIKDFKRKEGDKKVSFFKDENSNLILSFKNLESFEDSEVKLSELLKSINLSHIEIENDNQERYVSYLRDDLKKKLPSYEEFKNGIQKYVESKEKRIESNYANKEELKKRIEELHNLSNETYKLPEAHMIALFLQTSEFNKELVNIANGKSSPDNINNSTSSFEGDKYLLATIFFIEEACKNKSSIVLLDEMVRFERERENPNVNLSLNEIVDGGQVMSTTLRNTNTYFSFKPENNAVIIFGNMGEAYAYGEPVSVNRMLSNSSVSGLYESLNELIFPASTEIRDLDEVDIKDEKLPRKTPTFLQKLFNIEKLQKRKIYIAEKANTTSKGTSGLNISRRLNALKLSNEKTSSKNSLSYYLKGKYKLLRNKEYDILKKSNSENDISDFRKEGETTFSTHSLPTNAPPISSLIVGALKKTATFMGESLVYVLDGGGNSPNWNNGSEFGETSHYSGDDAFSGRKMASMEEYQARKQKAIETGDVQKSVESAEMREQSARLTRIANEIVEVKLRESNIKKIVNERSINNGSKFPPTSHPAPPEGMPAGGPSPDYNSSIASAPALETLEIGGPPPAYTLPPVPSAPILEESNEGSQRDRRSSRAIRAM